MPTRTAAELRQEAVRYELIPLGMSLLPLISCIKDWAETHLDEVSAARTEYDTATAR
ncbi:hypothetical protein GCM10009789_64420 [Kribbella sancticallisti]|uniref:HTH hxlR-type domain-containing protein n=1 Tax=Kribbella sancticallisti TaxID=460087 RepID=A0ABN2ED38_9ACTN